jgi:hypothetical protein
VRCQVARGCFASRPRVRGAYLACLLWMAAIPALAEHVTALDPNAHYPEGPLDAALCALTAHRLLAGTVNTHGDLGEGFIIVPD